MLEMDEVLELEDVVVVIRLLVLVENVEWLVVVSLPKRPCEVVVRVVV